MFCWGENLVEDNGKMSYIRVHIYLDQYKL